MGTGTIVFLAVTILLIVYLISIYNQLVSLKNRFSNGFAQIEVQLKRRYDLIPNLIEVAKKYLAHESETLEAVVAARNGAMAGLEKAMNNPGSSQAIGELASAENMLSGALGKLNVVVEAYPDLKANETMMQLSEELTSTENKVSFARQAFNDAVMNYNTYKQSFPQVMVANKFGHREDAKLLEFSDTADIQAPPTVSF